MLEHWNGVFLLVGLVLIVIVILEISNYFSEKSLIRKGVLTPLNKTTDKDIVRLKQEGHSIWAIKRYRQMNNGVSLKQAKAYVESLES